jgi:hypothetical protein
VAGNVGVLNDATPRSLHSLEVSQGGYFQRESPNQFCIPALCWLAAQTCPHGLIEIDLTKAITAMAGFDLMSPRSVIQLLSGLIFSGVESPKSRFEPAPPLAMACPHYPSPRFLNKQLRQWCSDAATRAVIIGL